MLESRCDPRIGSVLGRVASILPSNVSMVLVHSDVNGNFIAHLPTVQALQAKRQLRLLNLLRSTGVEGGGGGGSGGSSSTIGAFQAGGRSSYSNSLFSTSLWLSLKSEAVLVVQTDTWLCPGGTKGGEHTTYEKLVELSRRYDMIGAPDTALHFNGGFSLRSRRAMLTALQSYHPPGGYHAEDVYFSRALQLMNALPTTDAEDAALRAFTSNFTATLREQMEFLRLQKKSDRGAESGSPSSVRPRRLPPFPFHSARLPSREEAQRFCLRSGPGPGSHASWAPPDPLPLGFHRGESYLNPEPSSAFRAACAGVEAVLERGANGSGEGRC